MKPCRPAHPRSRPPLRGRRALLRGLLAASLSGGATRRLVPGLALLPAGLRAAPAAVTEAAAARWLNFCTFGPLDSEIDAVRRLGPAAWLDAQLDAPPSRSVMDWIARKGPPGFEDPQQSPHLDTRIQAIDWQCIWAPDAVRQRLAYALSQIFVISEVGTSRADTVPAYAHFWDLLVRGATGTFRQLLEDVSLSPDMAFFLTYLNNRKADARSGRQPDENYARELMQLFTLGLWELAEDGRPRLDAQGQPLPTYGQEDVFQLARVFTGWHAGGQHANGRAVSFGADNPATFGPEVWQAPLRVEATEHAPEAVVALGGRIRLPAGLPAEEALRRTLDALVDHPSCPPFIALNLIRRLTTSNPSPAYVRRVVAAFKDNGQGQRGDMKAVARAIFLDPEVLQPGTPQFGRLIDPYVMTVSTVRQLGAHVQPGRQRFGGIHLHKRILSQRPFTAPSVFNFNRPDHSPPGPLQAAGLVAPELQNCDEHGATLRFNGLGALCEGLPMPPELRALLGDPANDGALVDRYALRMAGRLLPAEDRRELLALLARLPRGGADERLARLTVLASLAWFIAVHPAMVVRL